MTKKIFQNILFLLAISFSTLTFGQEIPSKNWDIEKIKGVRQPPYPAYRGSPFFTDVWVPGKIELTDGVIIDSLSLRYSSLKDELVYYNDEIGVQINIDKPSLKGFEYTGTDGYPHIFRKQYYDNIEKGYRFFEVLSDGETSLLAYRKVSQNISSPYKEENGITKNMVYEEDYYYYFYSSPKGYTSVRPNHGSLLSRFDKLSQKPLKKLLRKNGIRVVDEASLILAWNLIEKAGYKVAF